MIRIKDVVSRPIHDLIMPQMTGLFIAFPGGGTALDLVLVNYVLVELGAATPQPDGGELASSYGGKLAWRFARA